MNERIKLLAEQAGWDNHHSKFDTRIEKFAQLIVEECAEVVSNQYSEDWGKWSNRMILEHFGVKE
jgi:hypothetical protein